MTPEILLLILTCVLLLAAIAVYVARNPVLARHNFQDAVGVLVRMVRAYLATHPVSTEQIAELVADAYTALPPSVQGLITAPLFETIAIELISLVEAALLQPPPAATPARVGEVGDISLVAPDSHE